MKIQSVVPWAVESALSMTGTCDPASVRFLRGAAWSLSGVLLSQGLLLLGSVLVANVLGIEEFGQLGIVNSTIGAFGILAGLGAGATASKHVAEYKTANPLRAGEVIGLANLVAVTTGLVISVGLYLSATGMASSLLGAPQLARALRLASVLLLANTIMGVQTASLAGLEAFRAVARVNVVRGTASFPLSIGGALLGGLPGAIAGLTLAVGLAVWIGQCAVVREARLRGIRATYAPRRADLSLVLNFSLPTVVSGAVVGPVCWLGNVMLANQKGGYAELGVFNAANQWRLAMLFVPTVLGQVTLPLLSSLTGPDAMTAYKRFFVRNLVVVTVVTIAQVIPLLAASPWIMAAYGSEFSGRWLELLLLVCSGAMCAVCLPVGTGIMSLGKMWSAVVLNFSWAGVFLACSFLWVPSHLALGLAGAYLVSYATHTAMSAGFLFLLVTKMPNNLSGASTSSTPLARFARRPLHSGRTAQSLMRSAPTPRPGRPFHA